MRKCTGGDGSDTTAAVESYLKATDNPLICHLYLIGEPDNPQSIWMTDCQSGGPVIYNPWGTFYQADIKRGNITTKIGLEVQQATVTWVPANRTFTQVTDTMSPLQLAQLHFYDNWPVRIWKMFQPTKGDLNTLGGCEWFGGRVGSCTIGRDGIQFTVRSFLDVVSQKVPANVIESTSTLAGYTGVTVPPEDPSIPIFQCFPGSTTTQIIADCITPTFHKIYAFNRFVAGYLRFLSGAGATLAGVWSAIGTNNQFTDGNGNTHSLFGIYSPLPQAPTPGVDTFYVSLAAPINLSDGVYYYGFPFVPAPTTAV